jgi:hypothetical protein
VVTTLVPDDRPSEITTRFTVPAATGAGVGAGAGAGSAVGAGAIGAARLGEAGAMGAGVVEQASAPLRASAATNE